MADSVRSVVGVVAVVLVVADLVVVDLVGVDLVDNNNNTMTVGQLNAILVHLLLVQLPLLYHVPYPCS